MIPLLALRLVTAIWGVTFVQVGTTVSRGAVMIVPSRTWTRTFGFM